MARFRKIDPRIWNDDKFAALSHEAQRAFLYVLTCPQMTALGAFRSSISGMSDELGISPEPLQERLGEGLGERLPKPFAKPFIELLQNGLIKVDEKAFLVFVPNFLKYNQPDNPNVVKGWFSALDLLPECPLLVEVLAKAVEVATAKLTNENNLVQDLVTVWQTLSERYGKPLPKPLGKPLQEQLPKPLPKPFRTQEQEQEQDIYPQTPKGASSASEVSTPAKKERRKNPDAVAEAQRPDEVTEEAWAAWMQVRKDKNAKHFSVYAFNLFKAECEKAGITLQKAVETCIAHHWASYRVEYQTSATNRNGGASGRSDEDNPFLVKNLSPRKQDDDEDLEVLAAIRAGMKG